MLSGTKLTFRLEGVKVAINTPGLKIKREHKELPNFEYDLNLLYVHAVLEGANVVAKVMVKEMKVVDYFKREPEKSSIKLLNASNSHAAINNIYGLDQSVMDRERANAQSVAVF